MSASYCLKRPFGGITRQTPTPYSTVELTGMHLISSVVYEESSNKMFTIKAFKAFDGLSSFDSYLPTTTNSEQSVSHHIWTDKA